MWLKIRVSLTVLSHLSESKVASIHTAPPKLAIELGYLSLIRHTSSHPEILYTHLPCGSPIVLEIIPTNSAAFCNLTLTQICIKGDLQNPFFQPMTTAPRSSEIHPSCRLTLN